MKQQVVAMSSRAKRRTASEDKETIDFQAFNRRQSLGGLEAPGLRMSRALLQFGVQHLSLTPAELSLALQLADHYGQAGQVFPSDGRLAERTGFALRTVQRTKASLKAKGLIDWERASTASKRCSYNLNGLLAFAAVTQGSDIVAQRYATVAQPPLLRRGLTGTGNREREKRAPASPAARGSSSSPDSLEKLLDVDSQLTGSVEGSFGEYLSELFVALERAGKVKGRRQFVRSAGDAACLSGLLEHHQVNDLVAAFVSLCVNPPEWYLSRPLASRIFVHFVESYDYREEAADALVECLKGQKEVVNGTDSHPGSTPGSSRLDAVVATAPAKESLEPEDTVEPPADDEFFGQAGVRETRKEVVPVPGRERLRTSSSLLYPEKPVPLCHRSFKPISETEPEWLQRLSCSPEPAEAALWSPQKPSAGRRRPGKGLGILDKLHGRREHPDLQRSQRGSNSDAKSANSNSYRES